MNGSHDETVYYSKMKNVVSKKLSKCKQVKDPTLVKEPKEKTRCRHQKDNWPVYLDGFFNASPCPWGYNWILGYCERSNNFEK